MSESGSMDRTNVLTAQLEQLLANAKRIKTEEFTEVVNEYRDLFDRYSFRLRPSVGSISLVSCSNRTPQLGFSNMTSSASMRRKLGSLKEGTAGLEVPLRPTPEKSLQSWLISEALHNNGQLKSIEGALDDQHSYWFVSDEIALSASNGDSFDGKGVRVVADLLVVRLDSNGESELVNVELKSERTTKTHGQIETFWDFMGPDQFALWRELADTMLGGNKRRWKELGDTKGIVIWPGASKNSKPSERTAQLLAGYKSKGIDTIGYFGPPYIFESEPSA